MHTKACEWAAAEWTHWFKAGRGLQAYTEEVQVSALLEGSFGSLAKAELECTRRRLGVPYYEITKTCMNRVIADVLQLSGESGL